MQNAVIAIGALLAFCIHRIALLQSVGAERVLRAKMRHYLKSDFRAHEADHRVQLSEGPKRTRSDHGSNCASLWTCGSWGGISTT